VKDIIGFGAINLDLFFQVNNFSALNETLLAKGVSPFIYGSECQGRAGQLFSLLELLKQQTIFTGLSGGGSAANVVVAAAKLGISTGIVGKLGTLPLKQFPDIKSTFLLDSLQGIDTRGLIVTDEMSGVCLCLIDKTGERSLLVFPNSNDSLSYEDINLSYLNDCRILHLSSFVGEGPFQAQIKAVEQLPKKVKVSLDPGNLYVRKGLSALEPIIKRCFIIFATNEEIEILTGHSSEQGCKVLLNLNPEIIVLKLGKEGSLIFEKDKITKIEAVPAISSDSTGAGDVYAAAFLTGLLRKKSLSECGALASKASAMSLSAYGRQKYPTKNEILSY
jgi:ribokinase